MYAPLPFTAPLQRLAASELQSPAADAPAAVNVDIAPKTTKPAGLVVLNQPSAAALRVLEAMLRDGTAAAVAADLSGSGPAAWIGNSSSSSIGKGGPGGKDAWAPFVAALSAAGFTTHALVRTGPDRLNDPEPPPGSMLDVPPEGSALSVAWAAATSFVSARKPLLHLDAECKGKVRARSGDEKGTVASPEWPPPAASSLHFLLQGRHYAVIGTDSKPIYGFGAVVSTIFWRESKGCEGMRTGACWRLCVSLMQCWVGKPSSSRPRT